jgi:hypothetical protein
MKEESGGKDVWLLIQAGSKNIILPFLMHLTKQSKRAQGGREEGMDI